jgi:hypothetical protein
MMPFMTNSFRIYIFKGFSPRFFLIGNRMRKEVHKTKALQQGTYDKVKSAVERYDNGLKYSEESTKGTTG